MTRELSLEERREAIDGRLEAALESARGDYLVPARTAVLGREDRWYGQLVALVANSISERPDAPSILRAATAMELFRGYYRLREQLLGQLAATETEGVSWNSNAALLASDYLHTSAYSTLGSLEGVDVEACIGTLASVSERLVETTADTDLESTPSATAYRSYVDGTAGALGCGAAVIGATLADDTNRQHRQFAAVGHGFSVRRRIRRDFAADGASPLTSPGSEGERLRQYAREQSADATRALRTLSSTIDVDSLRAFLEQRVPIDDGPE